MSTHKIVHAYTNKNLNVVIFFISRVSVLLLNYRIHLILFVISFFTAVKVTFVSCELIGTFSLKVVYYKLIITFIIEYVLALWLLYIKQRWLFLFFYIGQFIYISVNLTYYCYFKGYFHIPSILLLAEFKDGITALQPMDYIKVSILFADLPIIVFLSRFVYNRKNIITLKSLVIVSVTTIFLGTVNELQAVFRGTALYGINRYFISEKEIVKHYGIIVNEIVSLFKSGTEKKAVASIKYGLPKEFRKNSLYSPNIVVIQVESLGAGIENSVCENLKIAPFLFSLASESIYCQRIRSFHTSGGTTDCEMSVLNSIMPSVVYPTCKLTSYTFPNSIVKILNKSGYKTNAFHGNNGNFFNRGLTMSKMGFQEFFDIDRMQLQQQGWGASDSAVFSFVSTLLDKEKKLFFYYIITMSSHGPFTNVLNYTHEKYLSEKDEYIRHYYNSINYVDSELGRFILNIKNKFPDTYFVIIGDHSVNVPSPYLEDSHGVAENQAVEYVPFFMITPDRAVKKLEGQHSFLDIAPTILDIANVQCYFRTDGQSLIK